MGIILPHEQTGITARYDLINDRDQTLIKGIADRACAWVKDYRKQFPREGTLEPSWQIIAMDIATVHLNRGLRLYDFLNAPADCFLSEIVMIGKFVDRACGTFPLAVPLQYADPGVIPKFNPH